MKTYLLGMISTILHLSSFGQIENSSFENWDTTYKAIYEQELVAAFSLADPVAGVVSPWEYGSTIGVTRTTDSYSGEYAVVIHNWYTTVTSKLEYKGKIDFIPQKLSGYYKYLNDAVDGKMAYGTGEVSILNQQNEILAYGNVEFSSAEEYEKFDISLDTVKEGIADSIVISFKNAFQRCGTGRVCNLLFLDELTVEREVLTRVETLSNTSMSMVIYPNPAKDIIYIVDDIDTPEIEVSIYSFKGNLLLISKERKIDIANLAQGSYIIRVNDLNNQVSYQDIVIKN